MLQVTGYVDVFRGALPILGLSVVAAVSRPNASDVNILFTDNGHGEYHSHGSYQWCLKEEQQHLPAKLLSFIPPLD